MTEQTFFQKHRQGLLTIWRRDGCEWWRQHYIMTHGTEPPDGWWWKRPELAMGGQIALDLMRAFDYLSARPFGTLWTTCLPPN